MNTAFAATTAEQIADGTSSELTGLITLFIAKIPLYIAALIVILLTMLVARIARSMVENKLAEQGVEEEHKELQLLGGRVTSITIITLGVTVGLKIAGIDLTTIIAAVGFGIGFALKDLIMNFLAGMLILVSRDFQIGDFIKVDSTLGKVKEIQSRVTILRAIDGTKVIVPNAKLFTNKVVSFTSNPFRRIEVLVGVDYRHDLQNVLKIVNKAIKNTKGILVEPKPAAIVDEFGENSINIKVKAWVESRSAWIKIRSKLVMNIKSLFDEYGIKIPWPIRTVAYDKDEELAEKKFEKEKKEEPSKSDNKAQPQAQAAADKQSVQVTNQVPVPQEVSVQESDTPEQPLRPLGEKR